MHESGEEHVTIITGSLRVKLPGEDWKTVKRNEKYIVPPKSSFEVEASADVAYICYYKGRKGDTESDCMPDN
ncbi:MAG: pyrimidine/purine nucleoside phosphorylase [Acidobacteriota bacterium]